MNRPQIVVVLLSFLMLTAVILSGCATSGPKQAANLVSDVEDSRQALQVTKEQIQSTLDAANAIGQPEGGNLQSDFQRLDREVEQSGEKAEEFRKSVASMDKTGNTYFANWAKQLDQFKTEAFRSRSEARLEETRGRYVQVLTTMQQAKEKFNPFAEKLHDLMLYLNFNLNREGVAAMRNSVDELRSEAVGLYTVIDTAVQEADGFSQSITP